VWVVNRQTERIPYHYQQSEQSRVLAPLTATVLPGFLERRRTLNTLAWRQMARDWARQIAEAIGLASERPSSTLTRHLPTPYEDSKPGWRESDRHLSAVKLRLTFQGNEPGGAVYLGRAIAPFVYPIC